MMMCKRSLAYSYRIALYALGYTAKTVSFPELSKKDTVKDIDQAG